MSSCSDTDIDAPSLTALTNSREKPLDTMFTLIYYLGLISTTKHISTTLVFRF